MILTLCAADQIIRGTLSEAERRGCEPLAVAVLDAGGHLVALRRQDGASFFRPEIAIGKAWGAIATGYSGRELAVRAKNNPNFLQALAVASGGRLLPQTGGVLIKAGDGTSLGAVGVSGDSGEVDEACAIEGVRSAGFVTGQEE